MTSIKRVTSLCLALLLLLGGMLPAAASEFPPGEFILGGTNNGQPDSTRVVPVYRAAPTGNWVIHYDPNTPLSEKWEYVHRIGGALVERIDELEIWVVDVPESFGMGTSASTAMSSWSSRTSSSACSSIIRQMTPTYDRQWALPHIQAEHRLARDGRARRCHRRGHRHWRLHEP